MRPPTNRTLVVSGASGQLGRLTAELILDREEPPNLILVTRNPGALEHLAARGADVRFGDFDEPDTLTEAFAGGERLLLISATDLERRGSQHRAAIRAALSAGVRHVVYTSGLSPGPENPAVVAASHHATEQALGESGLAYTFLRNSLYAEYQVAEAARCLSTGRLVHNRGEGRIAYVSRNDCAAVAAAVLLTPGHEGAAYDVTGPELFGVADLASLYSALGGRPIEVVGLDEESFVAGLVGEATADDHLVYGAQLVASFGRSIREGHLESCTNTVAAITGRAPLTLRGVLEAHLDELTAPDATPG
jgi:NAD(P)H dehydrogenase (quinone)